MDRRREASTIAAPTAMVVDAIQTFSTGGSCLAVIIPETGTAELTVIS